MPRTRSSGPSQPVHRSPSPLPVIPRLDRPVPDSDPGGVHETFSFLISPVSRYTFQARFKISLVCQGVKARWQEVRVEAGLANLTDFQNLLQFRNEGREVIHYCVPNDIQVDLVITVNKAVAHSYY